MKNTTLAKILLAAFAVSVVLAGCRRDEPAPPDQPAMGELASSPEETAPAIAGDMAEEPPEQTTCPVMGLPIDPAIFAIYRGEKVFFCCEECVKAFESEPERYISRLPQFNVAGDPNAGSVTDAPQ